jgi:hypothetical protein
MTSTSTTGISEVVDEAAKKAQVYGAYVWAHFVLVASLLVILRRGEAAPSLLPEPIAGMALSSTHGEASSPSINALAEVS